MRLLAIQFDTIQFNGTLRSRRMHILPCIQKLIYSCYYDTFEGAFPPWLASPFPATLSVAISAHPARSGGRVCDSSHPTISTLMTLSMLPRPLYGSVGAWVPVRPSTPRLESRVFVSLYTCLPRIGFGLGSLVVVETFDCPVSPSTRVRRVIAVGGCAVAHGTQYCALYLTSASTRVPPLPRKLYHC